MPVTQIKMSCGIFVLTCSFYCLSCLFDFLCFCFLFVCFCLFVLFCFCFVFVFVCCLCFILFDVISFNAMNFLCFVKFNNSRTCGSTIILNIKHITVMKKVIIIINNVASRLRT